MKPFFFTFISLLFSSYTFAAEVDTLTISSPTMGKSIKAVVIRPDHVESAKLPTLYLLHGYSGNYADWVNKVPMVKKMADDLQMIIVCPDGGFSSWYWDIPNVKNNQYETFITKELIDYIQGKYPVYDDRSKRGITGLSMGGHGALYLAIKHQDVFGAAGSTSGGVDIRPFPNNWDMAKLLGEYADNSEGWDQHTVIELTHLIKPKSLELFIDCGTEDFFYSVNNKFHEKLTYLNIPHHYLTMPGGHSWEYWNKSFLYQVMFFNNFFSKVSEKTP